MAKIIPKRTLEEIRFANDIVDVIGSYISVKRAGSSFKALCPFHKEKTPSFHVNQQRQIFHCFGCGKGGDVFRFLMDYEGVDFTTAARMLAERAGMQVDLEDGEGSGGGNKAKLLSILGETSVLYHKALLDRKSAASARAYLEKRCISSDTIESFMIGYAPDRWDAILKWAERKQFGMDLLEQTGMVVKSDRAHGGNPYHDRFRNRIMFPINDEQGRVIGFSGRTFQDNAPGAKYVNTSETPLFHKGRILYALDKARREIVGAREAILCEGQIDVVKCHQAGFRTAVASQGTALTEDQVRILKRYADSVCLVFDPDTAGQNAAMRTAAMLVEAGLSARIAVLPEGEDPDSLITAKGAKAFQTCMDNARSAVAYQVEVLSARDDFASEAGLMRVSRAVLETIARSPSSVQRSAMIQEASDLLKLPAQALNDDLNRLTRRKSFGKAPEGAPVDPATEPDSSPSKGKSVPPEETALCEQMVYIDDTPELAELIKKYLPLDFITSPKAKAFVAASLEALESGKTLHEVMDADQDEETAAFAARVQMAPNKVKGTELTRLDAAKDQVLRIWRRKLRAERDSLSPDQNDRRAELTYDLDRLKKWETGSLVIKIETGQ